MADCSFSVTSPSPPNELPPPPAPSAPTRLPSLHDMLNPTHSSDDGYADPPWTHLPDPSKRHRDSLPPVSGHSSSPADPTPSRSLVPPPEDDFTPTYSMRSRHSFPYDPYSSRNMHQYSSDYEQEERSLRLPDSPGAQYNEKASAYTDAGYRSYPVSYHEEEARRRHSFLGYAHGQENYESHACSHESDPETSHPHNALPPPPPTTLKGAVFRNYPNPVDIPPPSHQRFTQIYHYPDPVTSPSTPAPVPPHQFHVVRFQPQPTAQSPSPPPPASATAPQDSTEATSPRASRSHSPLSRDREPISTPQGYLCRICATAPTATTTPSGSAPIHPRPPKVYANLGALRLHVKLVHEKGRRFACETCGNHFFRKQDLERHLATHLPVGYKPFQCGCGVRFTRRDALVRHVKAQRCG